MAETRRVIREKQVGVTPSGKQVVSERTQVSSSGAEKLQTVSVITNLIYYVFAIIEFLLIFRFILKIFGANPGATFVSFIYSLSGIFESPFRGIFASTTVGFEPSTLVAMLVYVVVALAIVELIKLITATNLED